VQPGVRCLLLDPVNTQQLGDIQLFLQDVAAGRERMVILARKGVYVLSISGEVFWG